MSAANLPRMSLRRGARPSRTLRADALARESDVDSALARRLDRLAAMPYPLTVRRVTTSGGEISTTGWITSAVASPSDRRGGSKSDKSSWPPVIGDRCAGSNDFGICSTSPRTRRGSRAFLKVSPKRTCWISARTVEGEGGGRLSVIASPVRLSGSRTVMWSSARRTLSNLSPLDFIHLQNFHSSIPITGPAFRRTRAASCARASGSLVARRIFLRRHQVSRLCATQGLNCTRVWTAERKVERGRDLWRGRPRLRNSTSRGSK